MNNEQPTISAQGRAMIRQRPSYLLMSGMLQASEATLELALENLHKRSDATLKWLKRLEAQGIEFSEPRFPEQVDPDPMSSMMTRRITNRKGYEPPESEDDGKKKINVVYTARWPIDKMSSDQVLIFADRLKFEASELADPESAPEEEPVWTPDDDPLQTMMSQMMEPAADASTRFFFISQLSKEQYQVGLSDALADAQETAETIAKAAGRKIIRIQSIQCSPDTAGQLHMMNRIRRQFEASNLAETSYGQGENEIVSESPKAAVFSVTLTAIYLID